MQRAPIAPQAAPPVAGQVGGDAEQPGAQRPGLVEAVERREGADECLLGGIFRVGGVTQDKVGQAKDRLLMATHQRLPGRALRPARPPHQVGLVRFGRVE